MQCSSCLQQVTPGDPDNPMKQPTHPSGGWVPAKAHASFTQGVDYEAMISNGFQPHLSVLFLFHRATTQHLSQTLQVWHIYLPTLTIIDPNVSNYGIHGVFGYSIYPCQYTLGLQPYPQVPWYSAPLAPTPVPPSKRRWDRSPKNKKPGTGTEPKTSKVHNCSACHVADPPNNGFLGGLQQSA